MRLYLSSLGLGDRGADLVRQVGTDGRVAVVANAMDCYPDRPAEVDGELQDLAGLGLDPFEVDLREHDATSVAAALAGCSGLWVRGGNTFVLREAMARSGLDTVLPGLVARDALAYAGYSAGCCVLGPTLRGIELCDDPGEVARTYGVTARYDGLGVLDTMVVPHVGSDPCVEETIRRYEADSTPYVPLRDGEVIVVDGQPDLRPPGGAARR